MEPILNTVNESMNLILGEEETMKCSISKCYVCDNPLSSGLGSYTDKGGWWEDYKSLWVPSRDVCIPDTGHKNIWIHKDCDFISKSASGLKRWHSAILPQDGSLVPSTELSGSQSLQTLPQGIWNPLLPLKPHTHTFAYSDRYT